MTAAIIIYCLACYVVGFFLIRRERPPDNSQPVLDACWGGIMWLYSPIFVSAWLLGRLITWRK